MEHRQAYFGYTAVARNLIITKSLINSRNSEYSELILNQLLILQYYLWFYLNYQSSFSLLPKPLLGIFLV